MISVQLHLNALDDRIDTVTRLLDATHPSPSGSARSSPISREARGLAIVLLFAAYENLLTSLTRTLLEAAIRTRVGNRRLRPGLRAFALVSAAKSIKDTSEKKLYSSTLPKLVYAADPGGRVCTIDASSFPSDGSFMKRSQITVWCQLFGISDPHLVLHRTWAEVDTVVADRNAIAHGRLTPDEVGRNYTEAEIRSLVGNWQADWRDFVNLVETRASSRDFFRTP
jgi:hypothetical protein